MKIFKNLLFVILLSMMMCNVVFAAENYIIDDSGVLKASTKDTVNKNMQSIYDNTEVTVKINVVQSLNGKDIDTVAREFAKSNIKGDQYVVFTTSIKIEKIIYWLEKMPILLLLLLREIQWYQYQIMILKQVIMMQVY